MTCAAFPPATGFVSSVLNYIDCQAQTIGGDGYQALAATGSPLSLVLTGLLTIFVALIGYRMLLGQSPTARDGVLALVKIGIVLALATSWAAYRTLVYDVALAAPAQVAGDIGVPAGLPGAAGGLVPRLDNADRLLAALVEIGPGDPVGATSAPPPPTPPYLLPGPATGVPRPGEQTAQPPVAAAANFDNFWLSGARILFLAGAIGALAAVRVIAGVLLALGPFFFAFLLFDGTRGLFEGWLRVLAGAALGALGTALALGVQLAFVEPRLAYLLSLRQAGYAIPGAPIELFVIMLVFTLAILALVIAAARVAYGFRMPFALRAAPAQLVEAIRGRELPRAVDAGGAIPAAAERPRAARIADAVAATQRRETAAAPTRIVMGADGSPAAAQPQRAASVQPGSRRDMAPPAPIPISRAYRRTRNRASGSATRRDRGG